MSVSNGQSANEDTFNDAFPSRTDDTSTAGQWNYQNDTDSTSPITGSITTDGGLGVAKNLNVGGVFHATQIKGTIKTYAEQIISALGTVNFEANQSIQYRRLSGDGGAITLATVPFGDVSTLVDGAQFILLGLSDTNNVRINDTSIADPQYGVWLFGDAILKRGYKLFITYDAVLERFIEDGRNF